MKDSELQHLNKPLKIVPNTHTDTPKLIVAKPAPTIRKHCKRTSFHFVFFDLYLFIEDIFTLKKPKNLNCQDKLFNIT